MEGIANTFITINGSSGREIWCADILHQTIYFDFIVVDVGIDGINTFCQVVRRHVSRHAYGDTRSTVDQQSWNPRW